MEFRRVLFRSAVAEIAVFGDRVLGKGIVHCHDTPGFVANRIGTFWLQCAVVEAIERGLTVEEADAVMGRPLGIPKTGVFGLLDLVGLDLMPKVRSEEHTSELQSLMRISYAVFCL